MISIFYGENTLASRNALNAAIDGFRRQNPGGEIVRLNGDKITETELVEAIEATGLLSNYRLVVIEGLLSRRLSKEKNNLVNYLATVLNQESPVRARTGDSWSGANLILWEPKAVAAGIFGKFAKLNDSRIQEFKLTRSLFKLLDSLRPGNSRQMSLLINETLKSDPAEVIMLMLGRRIAQLLVVKSGNSDGFSGLQDWQIRQLTAQAANWSEEQLMNFHRRLVEVDEAVKTGSSAADLSAHLDILLLSL